MNRRKFFKQSLYVSGGLIIAPIYVSCSNDDDFVEKDNTPKENKPETTELNINDFTLVNFNEGVASFDPTESKVIIWTRFNTSSPQDVQISWQIAKDVNFTEIIDEGKALAQSNFDHTLAIDIQDLPSNSKFYYRFFETESQSISVVGETITLPSSTESVNKMTLAVASCANYAAGLFNTYDAMANSDADIIVHLGDYIYEYGEGEYGTNSDTVRLDRVHSPKSEIISVDDYRKRYKQYRSDKSLQLAHQKKPFICVWDDHEVTNDAYKNGAENHTEGIEGSFEARKKGAIQVYSEFIPVRTNDPSLIYRSFDFGNLLSLHMLDTRIIGRDKQLSITDFFTASGFNETEFQTAYLNSNRKLLGDTQLNWVTSKLNSSNAKWQVIGQQILMAKMFVPIESFIKFSQITDADSFLAYQKSLSELVSIKKRILNGETVTPIEKERVSSSIPYNLDAWDGYAAEREQLLTAFKGKKVINLAGDTHNAWFSNIKNSEGNTVATELATSSISSPGFESFLPSSYIPIFEKSLETLIDDLMYFNASERGYLEVEFTPLNVTAKWNFVSTLSNENYTLTNSKTELIS